MLRKQLSRKWEGPQNFICPGATKRLVTPLYGTIPTSMSNHKGVAPVQECC